MWQQCISTVAFRAVFRLSHVCGWGVSCAPFFPFGSRSSCQRHFKMGDKDFLSEEVERLRSLLEERTEERDDYYQKYQIVNQQLQQHLAIHKELTESDLELELVNRDQDAEQKLREEVFQYREHIGDYTRVLSQQNARLDELHAKVEEYRSRCSRLERALSEFSSAREKEVCATPEDEEELDRSTALAALKEERERCTELRTMNVELRKQLEVTTRTNEMLSTEVNRLSEEWQSTREDLVHRASTEDMFVNPFLQEQGLMKVWKEAADLKREFDAVRGDTESSLASFRHWVDGAVKHVAELRLDESSPDPSQRTVQQCLHNVAETLCSAAGRRKLAAEASSEAQARIMSTLPKLQEVLSEGTGDVEQMTALVASIFADLLSTYEADCELLRKKLQENIAKSTVEGIDATKVARPQGAGQPQSSAECFRLMAESLTMKHQNITRELNNQIEKLHEENDQLHKELREAHDLDREHRNLLNEAQAREKAVQQELNASTRMQESVVAKLKDRVRHLEGLVKTLESNVDSRNKEKVELETKMSSLRTELSDLKESNDRLMRERDSLQATLKDMSSVNEELRRHNESLDKKVKEVEQSKFQLSKVKSDLELQHSMSNEKNLSLERLKEELIAEKKGLIGRLETMEALKRDLENTLSEKTKESNDLQSELLLASSQKDSMAVEIVRLEEHLQKLVEERSMLMQENEKLMRSCADHKAALETAREENSDLLHDLFACRDERDAWEAKHWTTATELAAAVEDKKQLSSELEDVKAEKDRLNKLVKKLKSEWDSKKDQFEKMKDSLKQQLQDLENEFSAKQAKERESWEVTVESLQLEKQRLEEDYTDAITKHDELETKHRGEILAHEERLRTAQRNFEEKMIQFEQMKAQITMVSEKEKLGLEQALSQAKEEAADAKLSLDASRKEWESRSSQLESELMEASTEVNSLKMALERVRAENLMVATEAESSCTALKRERDRALEEVSRLRRKIEDLDDLRKSSCEEISDVQGKNTLLEKRVEELLHEMEKLKQELALSGENCHRLKELVSSLQRQLDHASKEKEEVREEAAEMYRKEEKARAALAEECGNLKSRLRGEERKNSLLVRELEVVQDSLKECSISLAKMTTTQSQCEERESLAHREASQWKQKVSVLETECEQERQERSNLALQVQEMQHQLRLEQESHRADSQRLEHLTRAAKEERNALDKQASDTARELYNTTQELNTALERIKTLESRLRVASESKRTAEDTLHGLYTALRCTLSVWNAADGMHSALSPIPPHRASTEDVPITSSLLSVREESRDTGIHSKSSSPGRSHAQPESAELRTAAVVSSVDSLVQNVHRLEMEADEARATISRYKRQVTNLQEDILTLQNKLEHSEEKMKDLNSDKQSMELKLHSHHETITTLQKKLDTADRDKDYLASQLSDANRRLELKQHECDRLRESNALHETRSAAMLSQQEKASESSAEAKLTRVEIEKQTLEAKLKHLRGQVKEKENECQTLKLRIDEANEDRRALANQKVEYERKLQHLEARKAELNNELEHTKAKILSYGDQLMKETAKAIGYENKIKELERQLRDAGNDIAALNSQNRRQSSLVLELRSKVNNLESRLSSLQTQLTASEKEAFHRQMHGPSEVVDGLNLLVEGLRRENGRLQEEIRRLQQQLSDTINGFLTPNTSQECLIDAPTRHRILDEGARNVSEGLSEEVLALRRQNCSLENKIRDLKDQIAYRDRERSEWLSKEHRALNDEISSLRAALRQSGELSAARERTHRQEVSTLEAQVNKLRADVSRQRSLIERSVLHGRAPQSDLQELRDMLNHSLHSVSETPERLGAEARSLASAVDNQLARDPSVSLLTPSKLTHKKRAPPKT